MMQSTFDVAAVRARFPGLNQQQVYLDNAGGSQVLDSVIESICEYLSKTNVQLGATYNISKISTTAYDDSYKAAARFINASVDEISLGVSTTQLFHNLSTALDFQAGDELILSKLNHEANNAPWLRAAERLGMTVKWWSSKEQFNIVCDVDELKSLLSEKTKLVTFPHVSNLTGTITNVREITDIVHKYPNAMVCVDGVALAPHRQVDVKALDVDFYGFSWYKVYGPHMSQLYASSRIHSHIKSLAHFFKTGDSLDLKLNLASANYELVQSIPKVLEYFEPNPEQTWERIADFEEVLQEILLKFLRENDRVVIWGEPSSRKELRVPVISFTVKGLSSKALIDEVEKRSQFGFRNGHMYSLRMVEDIMHLEDPEDGVVRVSLLHYNTEEEITGLVKVLNEIISQS